MGTSDKLDDDYRELDLQPGASLEEVKNSYRELAMFWHPDQFHDRPSRLPKAHQKMTRINLAYERIRKDLAQQSRSGANGPKASPGRQSHPQPQPESQRPI